MARKASGHQQAAADDDDEHGWLQKITLVLRDKSPAADHTSVYQPCKLGTKACPITSATFIILHLIFPNQR